MKTVFCLAIIMFCCTNMGYHFDRMNRNEEGVFAWIMQLFCVIGALAVMRFG